MKIDKQYSDFIQWDVLTWSKSIDFWEKFVAWEKINLCLEIGGREGGLSLWLALKNKKVICSDLSDVKKIAEPLHLKNNVQDLISYEDIDATQIPYENHFDLIVFKSVVGGIARNQDIEIQKKVFEQLWKALKPGGVLLFAENLTASPVHQFFRKKMKWGSYWRYITIEETRQFCKKFSSVEFGVTGFSAAFGRSENQRRLLASFDHLLFNKITPKSWKYVIYGIATK